ncbi:uncharacterized protein LOC121711744 [Alosa sapidissima]|uniref:uncharacterized protein LOC121711744 n=1 Tax=Alosa sapidissima TaxID=34773 RepID=UPI001C096DB4|nr:uncharacterized protein LOC121711744 [Alosa sapidissima]XP_041951509.1 uncharacterized protein LOC121711744 [Alosa sapidissima]
MSECSPIQGYPTVRSHQLSSGRENNSSVLCDVIAAIKKLNDDQWMAITGGMSNIARLDFAEICLCIISNVSKSACKMFMPIVQILDFSTTNMEESQQSLNSPDTAVSTDSLLKESPLDIPLVRALCVQIVQEVKAACLVAIERIALSRPFTGSGDGWKDKCFRLEEETFKVFFKRLDELDLFAQKPDASSFLNKKQLMELEVTDLTQQVVTAILTVIESSCPNREHPVATTDLLHVVAKMRKFLASPKTYNNTLPLGSYSSSLNQGHPLQLTSDFNMKAFKTVLEVLFRSINCPFVDASQFKPDNVALLTRENSVLSYVITACNIISYTIDTVLEVLVALSEDKEEEFCFYATEMFLRVQYKVKQFMILGKISGMKDKIQSTDSQPAFKLDSEDFVFPIVTKHKEESECERSLVAMDCVDYVTTESDSGVDPPVATCKSSLEKETCVSQKPTIAASDIAKELDVGEAVARLEDFINSGEIHKFSLELTKQVLHLLKKSTCQRVNLAVNQTVSDTDLPSPQRGNNEIDSSSVSLEFAYMFAEDSVKCFLHQLLFPSCPSKVSDPDDFIQSMWSFNPCLAMAAHESCSGNTICSSRALRETVDLLREVIVNQVMGSFSPAPAFPCASRSTEDAAGTTSCFETADEPNSKSTTANERKRSKKSWKQKLCILPKMKIPKERIYKKYFSRRNAVSPLAPNLACPLDIDTAEGNHLLENLTFTSSVVIISEPHASTSQQIENVPAPDTAAKKPKKRNIFTKFFWSITKSLQTCFKK